MFKASFCEEVAEVVASSARNPQHVSIKESSQISSADVIKGILLHQIDLSSSV